MSEPENIKAVTWEAYEHHHSSKGSDWYWILGIIALAITIASVVLGNMLFGILVFVGSLVMALHAAIEPKMVPYAVTQRGIRIGTILYPYSTLQSFYIDEESAVDPELLIASNKLFMPLIVIPLPEEHLDEIEDILSIRLPEEHLEEPLGTKLLEIIGF